MENRPIIEVDGVGKKFGSTVALRDVSFKVEKGELVGLLGRNGAGKTTLMRIMTCFFPPTSGTVRVCGLDVGRDSLEVRKRIGYLLEKVPLYLDMRVSSFLLFVSEIKGVPRGLRKRGVGEIMEVCGLTKVARRIIGNLSKGFRQRVGLAQSLINAPEVLVLDEPTIGLDPNQVVEIREFIRGLSGDRTVILSSHDLHEINQICTQVVIIDEGCIVAVGTPTELGDRLEGTVRVSATIEGPEDAVFKNLKRVPAFSRIEKEKGADGMAVYWIEAKKGTDIPRNLGGLVSKNGWILREIKTRKMDLEEIFLKLVA